jgi:hypothetical protein
MEMMPTDVHIYQVGRSLLPWEAKFSLLVAFS